ncbi:MAG TPA: glycosyltransferase family 4 protein [Gemmatimonadales bacterium]|nr:glycosyltransferase family 4 protein [Gemmatimonadales bacterium]
MRLVFVLNDARYFRLHWLPRALAAQAAGYDVHVLVPPAPELEGCGVPLHPFTLQRKGLNPLRELHSLLQLRRLLATLAPDIVHTATVKPNLYGGGLCRLAGRPVVMNVTGLGTAFVSRSWPRRVLQRLVLAWYRWVAAPSNAWLVLENGDDERIFAAERVGDATRRTVLAGAGVDLAEFHASEEPGAGAPLVVMPARLLWDKGAGEFAEAARRLRAEGVCARFALVGGEDPDNRSAIPLRVVQEWVAEGILEWWGFRGDMPDVLASAAVVCLPSYREGMPGVLLEAAAAGRPVVTTDVPGCRDAVVPGETGLMVPARDADGLAAALRTLLADPALRQRMGQAARRRAEAGFSRELVVSSTLRIYRTLTGARP